MDKNNNSTMWLFLVNPRAGSGKTVQEWIPAEMYLEDEGVRFEAAYTSHRKHATTMAFDAAGDGFRKVVTVGGDGSVHEVFTGLMRWCEENGGNPADYIFGVVPIGSGNDWIKTTGIPHNPVEAVKLISNKSFRKMDVVRVEADGVPPCYMANVAGVGFDSHVCRRVNSLKEGGHRSKWIYLDALRHSVMHGRRIDVEVIADGQTLFSGEAYSIAVGNGKYSGGGMIQVPDAKMDDGLIDVTVVPVMKIRDILRHVPKLFTGELKLIPELKFAQCKTLEIRPLNDASRDMVEVDGELEGKLPVKFTMTDRQINILTGLPTSEEPSKERP
ncbi:MAG: diacylglycerol kinase family lipid kinase [Bacteroidales bacterium]|nr:diacylglycerol kinase family lipid kinase [Candidatus Cryptobacteroides equifaecalis]